MYIFYCYKFSSKSMKNTFKKLVTERPAHPKTPLLHGNIFTTADPMIGPKLNFVRNEWSVLVAAGY